MTTQTRSVRWLSVARWPSQNSRSGERKLCIISLTMLRRWAAFLKICCGNLSIPQADIVMAQSSDKANCLCWLCHDQFIDNKVHIITNYHEAGLVQGLRTRLSRTVICSITQHVKNHVIIRSRRHWGRHWSTLPLRCVLRYLPDIQAQTRT